MSENHIGIDLSKCRLDVAIWGHPEEDDSMAHNAQGIEALCRRVTGLVPNRIVVEAMGSLELDLATSLQAEACGRGQSLGARPTGPAPSPVNRAPNSLRHLHGKRDQWVLLAHRHQFGKPGTKKA